MTIVSITRKQICDAIAKEPTTRLSPGEWAAVEFGRKVKSPCSVCAVGAVLRNSLEGSQDLQAIEDAAKATLRTERSFGTHVCTEGDPIALAARGCYMTALSAFFEQSFRGLYPESASIRRKAVQKIKKDCISFVRKNFPARIEIDIDHYEPARDVKVVR